jgi:hypothetical protein
MYKTMRLPVKFNATLKEDNRLRVFENRMLRRISGPEREKVMGGWRRLHSKELHNLYATPHVIRAIKLWRMRRVGYVACMGEMRNSIKVLLENTGIDGRIILEWNLGE